MEGHVRSAADSRGLAGARVTLVGLADGTTRRTSTDSSGGWHFLALPPGSYDLQFRAAGFAPYTVHDVRIASGRVSLVDAPLEDERAVSIYWRDDPADPWASDYGGSFDAERLKDLPSARDIWALVENQESSIVTNEPEEGGFTTGTIGLAGALGGSWTQNGYRFNGLNVTDPFATGKPLVYPDYSGIEELQVSTALHSSEIDAPGASFNLTTRESSPDFHFGAEGYYLGKPFQSSNLDGRLRGFGFATTPHFQRFGQGEFHLGGALPRTKRWSFDSLLGVQHLTRVIPDFAGVPSTTVKSVLLHFDGRLGPKDRFTLTSADQIVDSSQLGAQPGVTPSATLRGYDRFIVVQGDWAHFRSSDTVWQVRGGFSHASPTDTLQHGVSEPNRTQLFTGEMAGSAPLESDSARSRFSLVVQGQAWRNFLKRRHELAFGFDLEESKSTEERRVLGGLQQLYYPFGVPSEVIEYDTPSHSKQRVRDLSCYLSERVRLLDRLRLRAGVHFDASNAFLPPQSSGAGVFADARHFAGQGSVVSWTTLSPRLGISVPLSQRFGGTVLTAGYARYYHMLPASYANYANPTSLGGRVYLWDDPNGDGLFQSGEEGTLVRVFGGPYESVDPDLKRPFTDEFVVGLDQHLGSRLLLEVRGFRRDQKRLIQTENVGVPPSAYTPVPVFDAGDDNVPGTADDRILTVFNQNPDTLGQDRYLLTNPPGLGAAYRGIEATVRLNLGEQGYLSVSFAGYKALQTASPGNTEFENDAGIVGGLFDTPNSLLNARGRTFFDRAYLGKIASYIRLPGGFYSGTVIRYADGLPFGRKLVVAGFNQGPFYVMATPRGEPGGFRTAFNLGFDQRIARDFEVGRFRFSVMLDTFNLLNSNGSLREYDLSGPLFPLRMPVEVQNPRVLRLGLRLSM